MPPGADWRSSLLRLAAGARFVGVLVGADRVSVAITDGELNVLAEEGPTCACGEVGCVEAYCGDAGPGRPGGRGPAGQRTRLRRRLTGGRAILATGRRGPGWPQGWAGLCAQATVTGSGRAAGPRSTVVSPCC
ncbi:hypothetical protein [Micromonospora craniellae]|uniref:hypothetical protein n=1 Tax=Micromonospora craniellae TaxID=2294034 RepID=UPI000E3E0BFB|nr:hypothetical protein [Micromonospora craniellae]QOC90828.1 hypothetical protein ID554_22355 [Micromonospora craniellae]